MIGARQFFSNGVTVFLLKNEPTSLLRVAKSKSYGTKAQGNQVWKGDFH